MENGIFPLNYINLGCLGPKEKDPAPGRLNYTSHRPDAQISTSVGSNQLTGNYREINRFCASLHESLDDVAKSQPLYVYIFPLVVAAFLEKLEIAREKADADANSLILLPEFSVYSYVVGQITGD